MPYRRRYKRRYNRRRYNRRPRYTTMGAAGFLAKKAIRGVRYLKGLVNAEKYHLDTVVSGAISTTPSVTHLTAIATGDGDGARTGNSILMRGLSFSMTWNMNASATNTWIRMVLVQDTQQIGDTTPAFTDIFDSGSSNIINLLNKNTLGRFKILRDKVISFSSNSKTDYSKKGFIRFYNHVRYNGTASSDIQKMGLYLLFVSNEATNTPTVSSVWRVFYYDN